jgi:hypothetical protein
MNFQSFNINNIYYKKNNILCNGARRVLLKTPAMCCKFGLEHSYDKYYIKLEFNKYEEDNNMIKFINLIKSIEHKNALELGIESDKYQSLIRYNDGYDPLLTTRIQFIKDKPIIELISENTDYYLPTIYDIKPNTNMKCEIEISKLWESQRQMYGCIIYIRKITLL